MIEFLIYIIIIGAVIAFALWMFRLACGLGFGIIIGLGVIIAAGCKGLNRIWRKILQRIRGTSFTP